MSDAIPGWRVEPVGSRDRARRPVADVIGDTIRFYRTRARAVLVLSALVEGIVTVVSLPYYASQLDMAARFFAVDPLASLDQSGAILNGAIAGLMSGLGFGGLLVLVLLVSVQFFALDQPATVREALGAVHRRWRSILLPIVLIAVACFLFGVVTLTAALPLERRPAPVDAGRQLLLGLGFLAGGFLIIGALLYLATRWAVAAPALIVDGLGLRASLARSAALTHRRMGYVALVVLTAGFLSGLVTWVFTLVALGVLWFAGGAGLPAWTVAAMSYFAGTVLVAPIVPLVTAVLYRDLRDAGPAPG